MCQNEIRILHGYKIPCKYRRIFLILMYLRHILPHFYIELRFKEATNFLRALRLKKFYRKARKGYLEAVSSKNRRKNTKSGEFYVNPDISQDSTASVQCRGGSRTALLVRSTRLIVRAHTQVRPDKCCPLYARLPANARLRHRSAGVLAGVF